MRIRLPYLPEVLIKLPGMAVPAFLVNEFIARRPRGLFDDQKQVRAQRGDRFIREHAKLCTDCTHRRIPGYCWLHRTCTPQAA